VSRFFSETAVAQHTLRYSQHAWRVAIVQRAERFSIPLPDHAHQRHVPSLFFRRIRRPGRVGHALILRRRWL
jgi:hypothetical protein